jgi:pilus assembly protein CpaB
MGGNEKKNFWLAVIAGTFAAILIYTSIDARKAEYDKKFGAMKTVIVAKENVAEMQTIYETMIDTKSVPSEFADPNAVTNKDEIVGKVAAVPINKGQSIPRNMLLNPGPDTGISNQVALSKRAISIPVDETRAVSKLIRPGDRVDIIVALDTGKGQNMKRETMILMQDVTVLATGVSIVNTLPRVFELDSSGKNLSQIALTGDSKYSTITIEADPEQAQKLVYILSTAPSNIFFTLRNPNDKVSTRLPSSSAETVLNKEMAAPAPPVMPAPVMVPQAAPAAPQPKQQPRSTYRRL